MKELEEAGPATLAALGRILKPFPLPDEKTEKRILSLIERLNHAEFAQRAQARRELEALEDLAEPALLRVLEKPPSEEVRRRVSQLLQPLDPRHLTPKRVFQVRALEVFGHIGTPAARGFVERLTRGNPRAWLTQEAAKTLEYLQDNQRR